jgi:hypothetical protein
MTSANKDQKCRDRERGPHPGGPIVEALTTFGLEREIVTIVGGFATALSRSGFRPDCHRSRAADRNPA